MFNSYIFRSNIGRTSSAYREMLGGMIESSGTATKWTIYQMFSIPLNPPEHCTLKVELITIRWFHDTDVFTFSHFITGRI